MQPMRINLVQNVHYLPMVLSDPITWNRPNRMNLITVYSKKISQSMIAAKIFLGSTAPVKQNNTSTSQHNAFLRSQFQPMSESDGNYCIMTNERLSPSAVWTPASSAFQADAPSQLPQELPLATIGYLLPINSAVQIIQKIKPVAQRN